MDDASEGPFSSVVWDEWLGPGRVGQVSPCVKRCQGVCAHAGAQYGALGVLHVLQSPASAPLAGPSPSDGVGVQG